MKYCTAIPGNRSQGSWSGGQVCLSLSCSSLIRRPDWAVLGCAGGCCSASLLALSMVAAGGTSILLKNVTELIASSWIVRKGSVSGEWNQVILHGLVYPVQSWSHTCFNDISNSLTLWTLLWKCITSTLVLPACVSVMSQYIPIVVTENAETGTADGFSVLFSTSNSLEAPF